MGKFEYSLKGLPHALWHLTEIIVRGGHWAASCTFLAEVAHKEFATKVAQCARAYGSLNQSQSGMFKWALIRELYGDVHMLIPTDGDQRDDADSNTDTERVDAGSNSDAEGLHWEHDCISPLSTHRLWGTPPTTGIDYKHWENRFFGRHVRVTRRELLVCLCTKLKIQNATWRDRQRLASLLDFEFYGELYMKVNIGADKIFKRRFVGHGLGRTQHSRRDFVRVAGVENDTCLTVEIRMFVRISGFHPTISDRDEFILPAEYAGGTILFSLVRWLAPHPDALLRDSQMRPIGRPPLDINHALWTFAEQTRPVPAVVFRRNTHLFGSTVAERVKNLRLEQRARFDLLTPDCFESYVNCTVHEGNTILETVTLPFDLCK